MPMPLIATHMVMSLSTTTCAFGKAAHPISLGNRSDQNPANRGPADVQAAGDLGVADTSAVQLKDFRGVDGRGRRPTQPLAVLPRMSQARPRSFPQNLPFELGEDRE